MVSYPIYTSTPFYSNFFGSVDTSGNILPSKGVNGVDGTGRNASMSLVNNDDAYLVLPQYGLKVYNGTTEVINYHNNTSKPSVVRAVTNNTGDSCKIYYQGIELT